MMHIMPAAEYCRSDVIFSITLKLGMSFQPQVPPGLYNVWCSFVHEHLYNAECWNVGHRSSNHQCHVSGHAVLDHEYLDYCSRTQSWSDHCTCKLWLVSIVCLDVSTTVLNLKLLSLKLKAVLWGVVIVFVGIPEQSSPTWTVMHVTIWDLINIKEDSSGEPVKVISCNKNLSTPSNFEITNKLVISVFIVQHRWLHSWNCMFWFTNSRPLTQYTFF